MTLPPEDGDTFLDNALPKARAAAAATGRPAIADDSGIEADALGGAPGVRSARFAGEHATDQQNLDKLLREAPAGSGLRYVCAVAYVDPGPTRSTCSWGTAGGSWPSPRGDRAALATTRRSCPTSTDTDRTMAELTDDEKDRISHRGRALAALREMAAGQVRLIPAETATASVTSA